MTQAAPCHGAPRGADGALTPDEALETVPYPWPWYGELDPARLALVLVTSPGFAGDVTALTAALRAAAVALRAVGAMVVEVRTAPPLAVREQPTAARQSLLGADLGLDVGVGADVEADHVVEPIGWDGFHGTPLDALLRAGGRDTLVLAGWWLEIAVHSTMRAANDRGYECLLATDLVAGLDPATTAGAISSIHMSGGIFGATGEAKSLLEKLA